MAAQLSSSFVGKSVPFSASLLLENGNNGAVLSISSHTIGCGMKP